MAAPQTRSDALLVVVMGVSGSGKTSVGKALAARLGVAFIEGDSLHPAENIAKMAAGIALTDEDRRPWLDRIGEVIAARRSEGVVVSCSALKRAYRERLRAAVAGLRFVHLSGGRALLGERLAGRKGHFMPPSLLDSQFATLEEPVGEGGTVVVDVAAPLEAVVETAYEALTRAGG